MMDPIKDDGEWLEAIRTAVRKEEDLLEGRKLKNRDC